MNAKAARYIDVNVSLSRWPFRRLPLDETKTLVTRLRELGVAQAWAGSFDALLHRDVASVNARLAEECNRDGAGILLAMGCVDPALPDWEEDLRRCHEVHRMQGIRLHPNYHGYTLGEPSFAQLLSMIAQRKLLLQIAVSMEDERTHHPLLKVPPVDVAPLPAIVKSIPGARIVLLNAARAVRGTLVRQLLDAGKVYFEIAMQEGVAGIRNLLNTVPAERILFGSQAPLFVPESAVLKMTEADLDEAVFSRLARENALRLLDGG